MTNISPSKWRILHHKNDQYFTIKMTINNNWPQDQLNWLAEFGVDWHRQAGNKQNNNKNNNNNNNKNNGFPTRGRNSLPRPALTLNRLTPRLCIDIIHLRFLVVLLQNSRDKLQVSLLVDFLPSKETKTKHRGAKQMRRLFCENTSDQNASAILHTSKRMHLLFCTHCWTVSMVPWFPLKPTLLATALIRGARGNFFGKISSLFCMKSRYYYNVTYIKSRYYNVIYIAIFCRFWF